MLEIEAANSGKVLVIGHRGAMGHAPENTMASFKKGLELGSDLIELDIHLSKDKELVVIHDADVSRTTNGHGHISDFTIKEIKKLDAGASFAPRFKGESIPTLQEVLNWAKEKIPLAIEIKGDPIPAAGIEEKLVNLLRESGMTEKVMVISFYHPALRRVKELAPAIATGILFTGRFSDSVSAARASMADSIRPSWYYWSPDLVEEVHKAGLTASTWTVNDEEVMERTVRMGLDSIGTNYPDKLRRYLDRIGRSW